MLWTPEELASNRASPVELSGSVTLLGVVVGVEMVIGAAGDKIHHD